jgi:hypothetical protein
VPKKKEPLGKELPKVLLESLRPAMTIICAS